MRALQPGQTWLCVAGYALAPFDISSVVETDAYLRLDVAVDVGDDNLVTCHSAAHNCRGFRLTRAASPLPAEIEELKSGREGETGHRAALDAKTRRARETTPSPWRGVSIEGSLRQRRVFGFRISTSPMVLSPSASARRRCGDNAASDDRGLEAAARMGATVISHGGIIPSMNGAGTRLTLATEA